MRILSAPDSGYQVRGKGYTESKVISYGIELAWKRPSGRPFVTWLQRVNGHCREVGLAGRVHVWDTYLRDPKGWGQNMVAGKS